MGVKKQLEALDPEILNVYKFDHFDDASNTLHLKKGATDVSLVLDDGKVFTFTRDEAKT